jgi:hypothetical protein
MRTIIPAEQANQGPAPLAIEIRPLMRGEDATAFRTLNEEWITRYFTLEEKDIETLGTRRTRFFARAVISSWSTSTRNP